ncbi:hypothetical protein RJ639_012727 [Escallonia herrerae]|uniref:X8 domain-containing protein n=1 Tax=Escallonia herrerae TaxID=1293975 RepID=A0AA88VP01_9ASTE|nr:hypothetical protein RJ639_012727 [Escallonia herrerae]
MAMYSSFALLFSVISAAVTLSRGAQNSGATAVELWCVAKNNAEDAALQSALDWACGAGGADCGPIQQGGPCYDAADIQKTASFAFNDYFLRHGMAEDSCNFDNTAALTSLNPSHHNCKFPSSLTVRNGSSSGSSTAGLGGPDSADLSGSHSIAGRWGWAEYMTVAEVLFI